MATAEFQKSILGDISFMGLRCAVGVLFIVHGFSKIGNDMFVGWMGSMGVTPEFAMIIALGEVIPGILLIIGVLSRISAAILSIIMLAAIFVIHGAESFTGDNGYELALVALAPCLVFIVTGPGRVSLAFIAKMLPRFLH